MTEAQLREEHSYRYNERLALCGQFGTPEAWEHNLAVSESNETIKQLRKETGIAAKLRELRESL